jgi:outer membrane protein OmpA-like peptidoglycan-associated protein
LRLANLRANKISSFLISQGVSNSQITINSEGESSPLYPNNNAENRRKNRRVEIVY